MDEILNLSMKNILKHYSKGGVLLINKNSLVFNGKSIGSSTARKMRLLYKYGYMKRVEAEKFYYYSISPQGLAQADLELMSI